MVSGYPVVVDVSRRLVVVVGGGGVGVRKVEGLIAAGAGRVRVVAPRIHVDMPGGIERVETEYSAELLAGAALVFAATDSPDVNDAVARDARAIGALVCRADADDEHAGDFSTPAMLRDGPLLVTVSSGGSPALSALIRDRLRDALDPRWARMAQAMQTLRPRIRNRFPAPQRRRIFRELCTDAAMEELDRGGVEGLEAWINARFNVGET